jgi:hypothetical protein
MPDQIQETIPRSERPLIALDGTESENGRGLFTLSALSYCTDWLPLVRLRMADVANENVVTAIDVFRFEHGIDIDVRHPADRSSPLQDADLYGGVGYRSAAHMRISEAHRSGIPVLLAMQFPEPEWVSPVTVLRHDAAFDPAQFGSLLGAIVKPWITKSRRVQTITGPNISAS